MKKTNLNHIQQWSRVHQLLYELGQVIEPDHNLVEVHACQFTNDELIHSAARLHKKQGPLEIFLGARVWGHDLSECFKIAVEQTAHRVWNRTHPRISAQCAILCDEAAHRYSQLDLIGKTGQDIPGFGDGKLVDTSNRFNPSENSDNAKICVEALESAKKKLGIDATIVSVNIGEKGILEHIRDLVTPSRLLLNYDGVYLMRVWKKIGFAIYVPAALFDQFLYIHTVSRGKIKLALSLEKLIESLEKKEIYVP